MGGFRDLCSRRGDFLSNKALETSQIALRVGMFGCMEEQFAWMGGLPTAPTWMYPKKTSPMMGTFGRGKGVNIARI